MEFFKSFPILGGGGGRSKALSLGLWGGFDRINACTHEYTNASPTPEPSACAPEYISDGGGIPSGY